MTDPTYNDTKSSINDYSTKQARFQRLARESRQLMDDATIQADPSQAEYLVRPRLDELSSLADALMSHPEAAAPDGKTSAQHDAGSAWRDYEETAAKFQRVMEEASLGEGAPTYGARDSSVAAGDVRGRLAAEAPGALSKRESPATLADDADAFARENSSETYPSETGAKSRRRGR